MKLYRSLIRIIVWTYLVFGLFLYSFQNRFLYHPTTQANNEEMQVEQFAVEGDIKINVFVINPGHDEAVMYFGGNAESIQYNAPGFKSALAQYTVYLINYRGYGGSGGEPSEAALYHDAMFVFDRLKTRHREISVIGRSLGSGVATFLAAERDVKHLVLITPFDSIENIAQQRYPVYPISLMLNDKYDSFGRVERIKAKVLLLIAENDRIIESWSSERLATAFQPEQARTVIIQGAGHNSISRTLGYYGIISQFLSRNGNLPGL